MTGCACLGLGWYWVDDGQGCVAREPCDRCGAFDANVRHQDNARPRPDST